MTQIKAPGLFRGLLLLGDGPGTGYRHIGLEGGFKIEFLGRFTQRRHDFLAKQTDRSSCVVSVRDSGGIVAVADGDAASVGLAHAAIIPPKSHDPWAGFLHDFS